VPGPGARSFWAKTIRRLLFHGPGGLILRTPMKISFPCRGDRPVARSARRMLRKPVQASKERANPADAFCPEAPCPRATTQASPNYQSATGESPAEPGVYLNEIIINSFLCLPCGSAREEFAFWGFWNLGFWRFYLGRGYGRSLRSSKNSGN
jgi:hypothetical protein